MFLSLKRRLSAWARRVCPQLFRVLKSGLHLGTGRAWKEDWFDRWFGQRDELTPPLRLLFDGTTDYRQFQRLGDECARHLIQHGLQPHHHVLEVGSGNGKNARALTKVLRAGGSYEGFDIVRGGVEWCQTHFTPRFPHFHFHWADIANRTYNPAGRIPAQRYRFPYDDETFDCVFLASVFTHMLPADLENYVAEIARVLKPQGRCFASFFLLTPDSLQGMTAHPGSRSFPFPYDGQLCRVADRSWPEDAVAYDERCMRRLFDRYGLGIAEPIGYGAWWRGQANSQDAVWAVKKPAQSSSLAA